MQDLPRLFAADGPISVHLKEYCPRAGQLEMAQAVDGAIEGRSILVAEAGTGTGKTLAYLVPAMRSGGKVIVSTATRTLQDQLFRNDIPLVRKALALPVTVALLKGRANYVCHYHLGRALDSGRLPSREEARHLMAIARFARLSDTGDAAECPDVPETSAAWAWATSSRENCLGQDCPDHRKCFVLAARKRAMEADLVVVNHHLFFADLWLRDEGAGELLPAANTVIFDEAHQLAETASLFFGESVSTGQVLDLTRDAKVEAAANAGDSRELPDAAAALEKAARDLRLAAGESPGRVPAAKLLARADFAASLAEVGTAFADFGKQFAAQAERAEGIAQCAARAGLMADALQRWSHDEDAERVRWVEVFPHALALNSTPLSVADIFQKRIEGTAQTWVFTSATLAVRGDFSHFCGQLGLHDATARAWESPFDFPHQALLYVPASMPPPNTVEYLAAAIDEALALVRASRGRAFLLFTSLRALNEAARRIREVFAGERLDYPVLVQGEESRSELLARFRRLGNAVLLGSQSFWEGVDVKGEALSLVVIDKLPFAPPDDPVLAARIEHIERAGGNAFRDYQLPRAAISLKQGAGRLIRSETDRGLLAILDPRLVDKPYGKRLWQALPPMARTRNPREATGFFQLPEAVPTL